VDRKVTPEEQVIEMRETFRVIGYVRGWIYKNPLTQLAKGEPALSRWFGRGDADRWQPITGGW
jgi:hypothetical protein